MRLVSVLRKDSSWSFSLHKSLNPISVTYVLLPHFSLVSLSSSLLYSSCQGRVNPVICTGADWQSRTHTQTHIFPIRRTVINQAVHTTLPSIINFPLNRRLTHTRTHRGTAQLLRLPTCKLEGSNREGERLVPFRFHSLNWPCCISNSMKKCDSNDKWDLGLMDLSSALYLA